MSEWKSIESVQVSRFALVYDAETSRYGIAKLSSTGNWYGGTNTNHGFKLSWIPTHWLPLPEPPK